MLSSANTVEGVFETIMAGQPSGEILPALNVLSAVDRQALLCTVCVIHDEIERSCQEHGRDVRRLLEAECSLFRDGVATCFIDEHVWAP